jgi:DNA gyrase subunit B
MTVSSSLDIQKQYSFKDIRRKSERIIKIGRGLIYSKDFQRCLVIGQHLFQYEPPFRVLQKNNQQEVASVKSKEHLFSLLFEEGKKGLTVQRYKGLGEMNPDQLWETTMNPDTRSLLQVKVEDVVDTDEIFTVLMGEEVEPRRDFIQNNALEVTMLDI